MKPGKVVKYLKNSNSPELRKQILTDAWAKCDIFFIGIDMSMSSSVHTFKVPSIPEPDPNVSSWNFENFVRLYDDVNQMAILPEEIKELVYEAAEVADAEDWNNFYKPILLRTLHTSLPMEDIKDFLFEVTGNGK